MRPDRDSLLRALLTALLAFSAVSGCLGQTPEELFDRGNLAYENGHYAEAAQAYVAAMRYGIEDVRLEYNMGNAAFQLGRLGEAILHYERAYRLDPTDGDILANLEYARSLRLDRVESPEIAAPVRLARNVLDRIGPDRLAAAILILVWIVSALLVRFSIRPAGWTASSGWTIALLACALVLVAASWWITCHRLEDRDLVVVLAKEVEILSGPGENHAPLVTVHEGLTLELRTEREDWIQVRLPDGLNGWVPRRSIGFV